PEGPVQAHHVVDSGCGGVTQKLAEAGDRIGVAALADPPGVKRWEAPALAAREEVVRRGPDRRPVCERVPEAPGVVPGRVHAERHVEVGAGASLCDPGE